MLEFMCLVCRTMHRKDPKGHDCNTYCEYKVHFDFCQKCRSLMIKAFTKSWVQHGKL